MAESGVLLDCLQLGNIDDRAHIDALVEGRTNTQVCHTLLQFSNEAFVAVEKTESAMPY